MTTYKTAELEGALLDAAVAKAEGFPSFWVDPGDEIRSEACVLGPSRAEDARFDWCPSSTWEQGGPIIQRENIATISPEPGYWIARCESDPPGWNASGDSMLEAAMRAYIASKLGETVELP